MTTFVHLEHLLGRRVLDARGKVAGRILTVHGVIDGPQCRITEFDLGTGALLERLGISSRVPKRVPWQKLDLTDPDHPRLRD